MEVRVPFDWFGAADTALLGLGIALVLRLDHHVTELRVNMEWVMAALRDAGILRPPDSKAAVAGE